MVVATVALCFMVTLGLCVFLGGDGFLAAFDYGADGPTYYLVCSGAYEDITLARNAAELVKTRGGAGYVIMSDLNEVVLSVYPDENSAQSVVGGGAMQGAYLKEVPLGVLNVKWAAKEDRGAAEKALGYFDLAFGELYGIANGLYDKSVTLADAVTRIAVLRSRIDDLRTGFNTAAASRDGAEYTEVKLALVTTLALIDNIDSSGSGAGGLTGFLSSLRYQTVQLVMCRQALAAALA